MNSNPQTTSGTFRSGEPLRASSLHAAFERQEALARRHVAGVHGAWGIVSGLDVRHTDSEPWIEVEPGAALDALGHWITLDNGLNLPLPRVELGPWLLVIRHDAAPRIVLESDVGPPGFALVLARWDGQRVGLADRRAARPRRESSPPRIIADSKTLNVPAITTENGLRWTARVDLGPNTLEGEVAAFVWPGGTVPAEATWSVTNPHPNEFTFSAANWPIVVDPETKLLSLPLSWVLVEVGRSPDTAPIPLSDGVNNMVANTRPAPASPGAVSQPFAIPASPSFTAGSTLKAEGLNAAMDRLDAIHALHNRTMHPRGIVVGLVVSKEADGLTLRVQPGLAIDATGHERSLDSAVFVSPPDEAKTAGKTTRSLALAATLDGNGSALVWRDPKTKTGPTRVVEGRDLVLATVEYTGGKITNLGTEKRRGVRAPDIRAGVTPDGATLWKLWTPSDSPPKGISTHVSWPGGTESPGTSPVVLAQLIGDRVYNNTILNGPTFVASAPDAEGFEFVVAFPEGGASAWAVESRGLLSKLVDDLQNENNWRVAWIAIGTDS